MKIKQSNNKGNYLIKRIATFVQLSAIVLLLVCIVLMTTKTVTRTDEMYDSIMLVVYICMSIMTASFIYSFYHSKMKKKTENEIDEITKSGYNKIK